MTCKHSLQIRHAAHNLGLVVHVLDELGNDGIRKHILGNRLLARDPLCVELIDMSASIRVH